jgi:hypothetical protein
MINAQAGGSVDVRRLRRLARSHELLIGHPSGVMHPSTKSNAAIENSKLAEWLHDGTARIMARPYLLQGLRNGMTLIRKQIKRYFSFIVQGRYSEANIDQIGTTAVGAVQEFVRGDYYKSHAPNAPSTIARKGSDTPLIDEAFLINSVTYVSKDMPAPKHAKVDEGKIEAPK